MTKLYSPPCFGVIFHEYGYRIVGEIPDKDMLKKIEVKSNRHVAQCEKDRNEARLKQLQLFENLWKIEHPIRNAWNNLRARLNP